MRIKPILIFAIILILIMGHTLTAEKYELEIPQDSCNLEEYRELIMKLTVNLIDNHDLLDSIEDYARCIDSNFVLDNPLDSAMVGIGRRGYGGALDKIG